MDNPAPVKVNELKFGTIFKIVFWSGLLIWIGIFFLTIIVAFVAPDSISINDQEAQTTAQALGAAPIFLIVGAVFSLLGAALGSVLLKLFGSMLPLGKAE